MKKLLHLLALTLALLVAQPAPAVVVPVRHTASNINLAVIPSRACDGVVDVCPAPTPVFFDATFTSTPVTSAPFLDAQCTWDFGDDDAATWSHGTGYNNKKNRATGLVAAHVYPTPGTYYPTVTCTDGTNTTAATQVAKVVIADPDVVFAGSATYCIAVVQATAGAGGCPAGATTPSGTNDFDAAVTAYATAGHRVLFKRGDDFLASTSGNVTGTLGILGAYGSGAKPRVRRSGNPLAMLTVGTAAAAARDWRVMDLDLDGQASGVQSTVGITSKGTASQVLILRVDIHDIGSGILLSSGDLNNLNEAGAVDTLGSVSAGDTVLQVASVTGAAVGQGVFVCSKSGCNDFSAKSLSNYQGTTITAVDGGSSPKTITISNPLGVSGPTVGTLMQVHFWALPFSPAHPVWDQVTIADSTIQRMWGNVGIYPTSKRFALLGTLVDDTTQGDAEFGVRASYIDKGVFIGNTLQNPNTNKSVFTLRPPPYWGDSTFAPASFTQYVVVADNKLVAGGESDLASVSPKDGGSDERHRFVLWERNWFVAGANTTSGLNVANAYHTVVRNNLFDFSAAAGGTVVSFGGNGSANPDSTLGRAYNNTFYKAGASAFGMTGILFTSGGTAMVARNNLMYAPLVTAGGFPFTAVRDLTSGGVTADHNTADGSLTTSPNFTGGTPSVPPDFKPTTGSYAIAGGAGAPVWSDFFQAAEPATRDLGAIVH